MKIDFLKPGFKKNIFAFIISIVCPLAVVIPIILIEILAKIFAK